MQERERFAPWVSSEAQALSRAESLLPGPPAGDIAALRAHYDAFNCRHLAAALDHYAVDIAERQIAEVRVSVVTAAGGVDADRVLICLHGGAFMWGRGAGALLEAVPVAAAAGMTVIAVHYALAPEQVFPVAVDEVVVVLRALITDRPAARIGLYGCSAGGVLTTQVVARLLAEGETPPGAIAMLCGTGLEMDGDSVAIARAYAGQAEPAEPPRLATLPYLSAADPADPLVFPGEHPDLLARFPPSLLVTGTRDFAASSVATMHRRLRAAGREAELLHFDGMGHAFHMATTLPESRETFAAMARFFHRQLA